MTNNPVYHFFHTPGNVGPLILRMMTAGIFFFHGTQKAFGWFGGVGWYETITAWSSGAGLGIPTLVVSLIIICELLICVGLFLGFFTRLAGFGVVVIMSGALFAVSKTSPAFPELEFPLMVWSAGLALFCLGGGTFSIDRAISKNLLPAVG
ncbi:MAG: DoxX family protein [Chthoniobacterales bacterium]|nr:DoxX family protein [Chthoniobacterales bacterium]